MKTDIATNKRQFDLVRYMRSELHQAGLITDEELTWLLTAADEGKIGQGSISRERLDDYDVLREQLTSLQRELERYKKLCAIQHRFGIPSEEVEKLRASLRWLDEFVVEPEEFPGEGDRAWWNERRQSIRDQAQGASLKQPIDSEGTTA